jgi:membrane-associated phospholipid phosphatase
MAVFIVIYYPQLLAVAFLVTYLRADMPAKNLFLLRALTALVIATFLAHVNRIFGLWPEHLLFPSGHTTFCAGLSWSLAMLRPWTVLLTVPLLIALAVSLVILHDHTTLDIFGAIPLVLIVYGFIHACWRLPRASMPPLDSAAVSP